MHRSTKARKCTETTTGDSKHPDEPSNCIICLEKVVCRGKLSVCNHWFCFPCILEWSENTNTCPICKTRFRCITKIHLDPFRSPPTKVCVGDRDQRVWNDDEDLVADDLDAIDSDDSNGDQESPFSLENSLTRSTRRQVHRRHNSQISRQLGLDDYDYEDSFIDDTDEALQVYLYATCSQEALDVNNHSGGEERSSGESSDDSVGQRDSPYRLRNRHNPRTTTSRNMRSSTFDSLPVDEVCLSPASMGAIIVSDDESSDEMNNIVAPTGNNSKKSKGKRKVTTRKHNSRTRKSSETSRPNSSTSRRSQRSPKPRKQQNPEERRSKSKRKRQMSASEDEFQPGTSSRSRSQANQQSIDGWISMATKRAKAHSSTSSTANQRVVNSREWVGKEKKPAENQESSRHSEPYDSSSDSENEVLSERIKKTRVKARSDGKKEKKCQNASKISVTTRESENKQTNKFCAREELQRQGMESPSPSTSTEIQEDDFSIVTFIKPTPQPDKKRSIFTRRLHRSPSTSFDHLKDFAISYTEMQQNQSGLTNHQLKTISYHKRAKTDLVHKSGIVIKLDMSPLIKKKKQGRKRVMSLSSDSD